MNLIPKICEMLGVEVDEEFKLSKDGEILDNGTLYKFNGAWFFKHNNDTDDWDLCCDSTLILLLNEHIDVAKLPFEPKNGDLYWVVGWVGSRENVFVGTCVWHDTQENYADKYCGNCFRTETEAEKHKYEIYEKLTGRKWEEKCDT